MPLQFYYGKIRIFANKVNILILFFCFQFNVQCKKVVKISQYDMLNSEAINSDSPE